MGPDRTRSGVVDACAAYCADCQTKSGEGCQGSRSVVRTFQQVNKSEVKTNRICRAGPIKYGIKIPQTQFSSVTI
jgi:hypothetical protein